MAVARVQLLLLLLGLCARMPAARRGEATEDGLLLPEPRTPAREDSLGELAADAARGAGVAGGGVRHWSRRQTAWCGVMQYFPSQKAYHFEVDAVGEEPKHVRHFAVELIRSPKNPRLVLHPGATWGVKKTSDGGHPVEWVPTALEDGATVAPTLEIDLVQQVAAVKHAGMGGALEILLVDGTSLSLAGGVYYDEEVMVNSLYLEDKVAERGIAAAGHLDALAAKFGPGSALSAAMVLQNNALKGWASFSGEAATVQVAGEALELVQLFSFAAAGGTALAGVGPGSGLGVVAGLSAAAAGEVAAWVKAHESLDLSASDKIFAKLICHPQFTRCGQSEDWLAPEGKECPA